MLSRKIQSLAERVRHGSDVPFMSSFDPQVVQQMFGEDLTLFSSALLLLLRDHAEFGTPMTALLDEPATRSRLQLRVHALRGSTGLLGATRITRLAGEAEAALEQGRPADVVGPILGELTTAFSLLCDEAASWLAGQAQREGHANVNAVPRATIGTDDLEEFYVLLDTRNLAALDKFTLLSTSLSELLGVVRFDALRAALDNMEFALGAQLLRQGMLASVHDS